MINRSNDSIFNAFDSIFIFPSRPPLPKNSRLIQLRLSRSQVGFDLLMASEESDRSLLQRVRNLGESNYEQHRDSLSGSKSLQESRHECTRAAFCIADVIPECFAFMGVRAFHDNSTWRHLSLLSFKEVKLIHPNLPPRRLVSTRRKTRPSFLVYAISHLELRNHFPMTISFRTSGFTAAIDPPFNRFERTKNAETRRQAFKVNAKSTQFR